MHGARSGGVVESRSAPRCPPYLFAFFVLPLDALGWALRKGELLRQNMKYLCPKVLKGMVAGRRSGKIPPAVEGVIGGGQWYGSG